MSFQGRELEYLLHPMPVADFFRDHWDKKAVHIPGKPKKFESIYDIEGWRTTRAFREVIAARIDDHGVQQEHRIDLSLVEPLFRAGFTICADVSDDPKLAPFLRGFCERLKIAGGPGFAKLYASADDRGFAVHTDKFHVFVLQIDGSKQWRFSRAPAVPSANCGGMVNESGVPVFVFPQTGMRMVAKENAPVDPPDETQFESVSLNPGDVLYLPPGTWHKARAVDRSIAVSISPPRLTVGQVMMRVIEESLLQRPEWRLDVLAGADLRPEPGLVQQSIKDLFDARVSDLKAYLDQVDRRIFHRAWQLNVSLGSAAPEADPGGTPVAEEDIGRGDRMVHRDGEPLGYLVAPSAVGKEEVLMYHRGAEWALPIEAQRFIDELIKHREFVAEAAMKWDTKLSWEDVRNILYQLLAAGIIKARRR